MFHWICPECGREIAPTVRECPVCDGAADPKELVLAGVVEASARTSPATVPLETSESRSEISELRSENNADRRPPVLDMGAGTPSVPVPSRTLPDAVKWIRSNGQAAGPVNGETGHVNGKSSPAGDSIPEKLANAPAIRVEGDTKPPAGRAADEPLIPEILTARAALDRAAEAQASMRGLLDRVSDLREQTGIGDPATDAPVYPSLPDARPDARVIATRTVESRAIGTKRSEMRSTEVKPAEVKQVEAKPAETKLIEAKPIEVIPVDATPLGAKTLGAKSIEAKPAEIKSAETRPVENTGVEPGVPALSKGIPSHAPEALAGDIGNQESAADLQAGSGVGAPAAPPLDRVPLLAKLSRLALPKIASSTVPGSETASNGAGLTRPDSSAVSGAASEADVATASLPAGQVTGVTPASAPGEPLLPTFAPSPAESLPESLNALLAAAATLDDVKLDDVKLDDVKDDTADAAAKSDAVKSDAVKFEAAQVDGAEKEEPGVKQPGVKQPGVDDTLSSVDAVAAEPVSAPDPLIAQKLPLPPVAPAQLPAVAPGTVSIGAVAPRPSPTMASRKASLAADVPSPSAELDRKIAGLAAADAPLPLRRPEVQTSARVSTAAVLSPPAPAPARSGAVRPPRSTAPFLAPNMAGLVRYDPLENRPLRPVAPPSGLRRGDTAPRITLPGPMLTRALVSFRDRGLTPVFLEARAFRKRFAYGWVAIVLAVGTVLGIGFSSVVSGPTRPPAEARAASDGSSAPDSKPPAGTSSDDGSTPASAAAASVTPRPGSSNPLSKIIEVTGFRIVMDPTRKAQVQYLIVNHSPARFPDATIYVTLHAADARVGQAPLCRFSITAPDLGPFEAKEMISAIEKTNRAVNLPDWQNLRAEIEIGQ